MLIGGGGLMQSVEGGAHGDVTRPPAPQSPLVCVCQPN